MASDKKPSIYSDRGNIGSAQELDEYGVWVKSEPQVLSAGDSEVRRPAAHDDDSLNFDDAVMDLNKTGGSDFSDIDFPDDNIDIDSIDAPATAENDLEDFDISDDFNLAGGAEELPDIDEDNYFVPTVKSIESNIDSIQDDFNAAQGEGGELTSNLLKKLPRNFLLLGESCRNLKRIFQRKKRRERRKC